MFDIHGGEVGGSRTILEYCGPQLHEGKALVQFWMVDGRWFWPNSKVMLFHSSTTDKFD